MTKSEDAGPKVHYICQTYVEKQNSGGKPPSLQIDKQIPYSTASQAQERAERESRLSGCVGADAYMISEDPDSGEVSAPTFLVRCGTVPENDEY